MAYPKESREFHLGLNDVLSWVPHFFGIHNEEQPVYEVVVTKPNFEIRIYKDFVAAETEIIAESYQEATHTGFLRLANYIFGKNREHKKWAMTSPVLIEKRTQGWKLAFIMPAALNFESLPAPLDTEIRLAKVPLKIMAALTYRGFNHQNKIDEKTAELTSALQEDRGYQIISTALAAQYDPPTTIPFLRKNEILLEVERSH